MKIAVVHQKTKFADTKENLRNAEKLVKEAAENDADIINFPEFFTTGFAFSKKLLEDVATSEKALIEMKKMASNYNIVVGGSYLNFQEDNVYNTYSLVFPDGKVYSHSKDIPTVYEQYCYTSGDEESVFHTPLGDIGVALCWEQLRYQTVKRMIGKIDFVLAGSCWWTFNEVDQKIIYDLKDINDQMALDAPVNLAKLLKVPVFHASHIGKFNGKVFPKGDKEQYREIVGASQIIDANGNVVLKQLYNEEQKILYYEFQTKEKDTSLKVATEEYWIPSMPEIIAKNWDNINCKCAEYYKKVSLPYMLKIRS